MRPARPCYTMTPSACCCSLLILPLLLLLPLLKGMTAGYQIASDSDEVDYIPKHVPASTSSTGSPAKASRLPNVLTSLEIPPAYLEEILRPKKSPSNNEEFHYQHQRLYQPHYQYSQSPEHLQPHPHPLNSQYGQSQGPHGYQDHTSLGHKYNPQIYQEDHKFRGEYFENQQYLGQKFNYQQYQRLNANGQKVEGQYYNGQHPQDSKFQYQYYSNQNHQSQNLDSQVESKSADNIVPSGVYTGSINNGASTVGISTGGIYPGSVPSSVVYPGNTNPGGAYTGGVYTGSIPSSVMYPGNTNPSGAYTGGVYTGSVYSAGIYSGSNDVVYGNVESSSSQWSRSASHEIEKDDPLGGRQVESTSIGPRFDRTLPRKVTVQTGKTAELACRVLDSAEKSVSWMRHEDLHILSVGKYKYSTDERVSVRWEEGRQEWVLTIEKVKQEDAGMYECQVSAKPVLSFIVSLDVVVPRAEVVHGPEIFVHRGSLINLTCVVTHGTQRPVYVYWYHHNKVLDYEGRGGVTVITKASTNTVSHLLMRDARPEDSGVYACRPSNGEDAYATLHVLNGEHRAAMQSDSSPRMFVPLFVITVDVSLTYMVQLYMSSIDGAP